MIAVRTSQITREIRKLRNCAQEVSPKELGRIEHIYFGRDIFTLWSLEQWVYENRALAWMLLYELEALLLKGGIKK